MQTNRTNLEEKISSIPLEIDNPSLTQAEQSLIDRVQHLGANLDAPLLLDGKPIQGAIPVSSNSDSVLSISNLAYSVLQLGLQREKIYHAELNKHAEESADIQKSISKLINLSGKFAVHAENQSEIEISAEMSALCQDLKEKGIDLLLNDENRVNRERMAELKADISSHVESLKTELQKTFTTKIQVKINELNSLLESLKMIEKHWDRLISELVGNQKSR